MDLDVYKRQLQHNVDNTTWHDDNLLEELAVDPLDRVGMRQHLLLDCLLYTSRCV